MPLTLTGLRCLVEIVDANLNISAAGQALHMSQPCVSRHLKQVEEALGFRVFARRGRSLVETTPAGLLAIEAGRRVVREVEGLRNVAANAREQMTGELRIAAPQTYARHILPRVFSQLRQRYPGLSVSMNTLGEGECVRLSEHRHCDAVVVSTAGLDVPAGIAVPLFRWTRVVIVAPGHPLAGQHEPVTVQQLAAWPLVTYEASRRPSSSLRKVLAAAGLQPQFSCSAHDADTLKAYVSAGLGVGLVSELSLVPADRDRFSVLRMDAAMPDCVAWAVLPQHKVLRNPTLDLVRLLAPQLDAADLRRAVDGMPPTVWPDPPRYA